MVVRVLGCWRQTYRQQQRDEREKTGGTCVYVCMTESEFWEELQDRVVREKRSVLMKDEQN